MAETIELLFPTESKHTFYIPGIRSLPARGKLYQAYKVYREKLSAANMICRRKRKRKDTSPSEHDVSDSLSVDDEDDAPKDDSVNLIRFFETHTHPWSEIVSTWEKTSVERDNIFKDGTVEEYLARFPCLGLCDGHFLFEISNKLFF